MDFEQRIGIAQDEPVFKTGLLLIGEMHSHHMRLQPTS